MNTLRPLFPLLIAAGFLLAGNGVFGTLIALRGAAEGFSTTMIGFMGTTYFAGFMLGCLRIPRILKSVGHIRSFAALAAIGAVAALSFVLIIDPWYWMVARFVTGFCFSALFTTIESWINSRTGNEDRGRVLSIYRLVDIAAVTSAQYMIPVFGPGSFAIFAVLAMLVTISLVPVSLADRTNPKPPEEVSLNPGVVWRISPIAVIGCVTIGMTNGAFRLVGPVYAQSVGFTITEVATFMSAGILGGALLQFPFGYLSDRWDRRYVLMIATLGAVGAGLMITLAAGQSTMLNMIGIFAFGAFALPLYSLSSAHANDHASESDYVQVAAGLLLFFAAGAMVGPAIVAWLMEQYGPQSFFIYTSVVHGLLIVATLYRMSIRQGVAVEARKPFAALLRTSPNFAKLTKRED